jgi:hypothetical protein
MPSNRKRLSPLRLRLPATSANLGPAFDAAALAMDFYIKIDARAAKQFSITATGRDREICGTIQDHLILKTYREVLKNAGQPITPLSLRIAVRAAVPPPPPGWRASPWRCTLAACLGPTRKLSAKLPAGNTMPTTPPPAGWAASRLRACRL